MNMIITRPRRAHLSEGRKEGRGNRRLRSTGSHPRAASRHGRHCWPWRGARARGPSPAALVALPPRQSHQPPVPPSLRGCALKETSNPPLSPRGWAPITTERRGALAGWRCTASRRGSRCSRPRSRMRMSTSNEVVWRSSQLGQSSQGGPEYSQSTPRRFRTRASGIVRLER